MRLACENFGPHGPAFIDGEDKKISYLPTQEVKTKKMLGQRGGATPGRNGQGL